MKKLFKNGVAILGAIMLLANLFLPGLVVYAENEEQPVSETPATTPETPATTPETPATTPEIPATTSEIPATTPETLATTPETLATTPETLATTPETLATTPVASSECTNEVEYGSSKTCSSLKDAINNSANGDTITLLKNIENFQGIEIRKNLTINLNSYSIKSDSSFIFDVYNNFILEGNGNIVGPNAMVIRINHGSNPTIKIGEDVVLDGKDGVGFWPTNESCQATLNISGTIKSTNTSVTINGNIKDKNNKSVINIAETAKLEGSDVPLYLAGYGETTISDGSEIKGGKTAIEIRAGLLTINGGKFTATTEQCPVNISSNGNGSTTVGAALAIAQHTTKQDLSVVVNGGVFSGCAAVNQSNPENNSDDDSQKVSTIIVNGSFNGVVANITNNSKLDIKGGTFSDTVPSEYLAEGANISVVDAEAKIGKIEYKTLQDAIINAKDGDTLYLLKNVDDGEPLYTTAEGTSAVYRLVNDISSEITGPHKTGPKSIIVDFQGFTYNVGHGAIGSKNTESQAIHIEKGSSITLKNGTFTSSGSKIKMLVQNYSNLTLENMTIDGSNIKGTYVMSNNFGALTIKGNTNIIVPDGKVAFDVRYGMSSVYGEGVKVAFDPSFNGSIEGIIEYGASGTPAEGWTGKTIIDIDSFGSKFDVKFKNSSNFAMDLIESGANIQLPDGYSLTKLDNTYFTIGGYTIKFDTAGGNAIATITGHYGMSVVAPGNATHPDSCYLFAGWDKEIPATMPAENLTITATWNYTCSRSSGGGGSSRSSSNNTMNEVVLGGEVEVNTGDKAEINTGDENKLDENNDDNNGNGNAETNDPELVAAYEWAYKNGITTMDTIEKARLKDGITRAELAKMMVVFMSEVLHMQPVITETFDYHDVNEKALGDLTGYIQLAYQYQIMGINADGKALQNFNPRGKVSRAEFATVLSRVLFGSKYNQDGANYYEGHIKALAESKILTNTDPKIQELRGWIILMLYRSQNSETNNVEENTAQVTTGDVAEVESGSAVEVATGTTAEVAQVATGDVAKVESGSIAEVATGTTAEIATGAVVEANTGSVAQTAIAETNTGDVAKVESGSTAEVATGDSK